MTQGEYLQKFDIFYNNISSNKAPGLTTDEIEDITNEVLKSLIIELATNSFEQTEEVKRYLAPLVKTKSCTIQDASDEAQLGNYKANLATTSNDVWYITYEYIAQYRNTSTTPPTSELYNKILVVPATQDSYYKTLNNPFRGPGKHRVLRLDITGNYVELKSADVTIDTTKDKYVVRYISKPAKITLAAQSTSALCDLPEAIQTKLLDLAVKKAFSLWDIIK